MENRKRKIRLKRKIVKSNFKIKEKFNKLKRMNNP